MAASLHEVLNEIYVVPERRKARREEIVKLRSELCPEDSEDVDSPPD